MGNDQSGFARKFQGLEREIVGGGPLQESMPDERNQPSPASETPPAGFIARLAPSPAICPACGGWVRHGFMSWFDPAGMPRERTFHVGCVPLQGRGKANPNS